MVNDVGPVELEVSRDRDAPFEPTGEVQAHVAVAHDSEAARDHLQITDRVLDENAGWQNRP